MQHFNNITLQLTTLSNNFSNNAMDGTAAFTKLITSEADLAGLPATFLAQAAAKVCGLLLPCAHRVLFPDVPHTLRRPCRLVDALAHAGQRCQKCDRHPRGWALADHAGRALLHSRHHFCRQQVRPSDCAVPRLIAVFSWQDSLPEMLLSVLLTSV